TAAARRRARRGSPIEPSRFGQRTARMHRSSRSARSRGHCGPDGAEARDAGSDPMEPGVSDIELARPDDRIPVRSVFGIDSDLLVPAFRERDDHVPEVDEAYRFNPDVTMAILAGFARNRRVMIQGLHGTGKSTHIEQVAARLNWPCVRVNLDGHISRLDLVGKDAIILREGKQVTE